MLIFYIKRLFVATIVQCIWFLSNIQAPTDYTKPRKDYTKLLNVRQKPTILNKYQSIKQA